MRDHILLVALLMSLTGSVRAEFVPVEKFTQGEQFSRARLSPDGRHIACLQDVAGDQLLLIVNLDTKKSVRIEPGYTGGGLRKEVGSFRWISDRRVSFATTVWDGQAITGVSAVDCDGKKPVAFAGPDASPGNPYPLLASQIIHSFEDKGQSVLMVDRGSNSGSDLVYPDVVQVSTLTQSIKTVVKNPGNVVGWVPDHAGVVRLGLTRDGMNHGVIYRENEQAKWRSLPPLGVTQGPLTPLGFDYTGKRLIVAAANAQKRRAVYYYDLEAGRLGEEIASDGQFDIIPENGAPTVDGVYLTTLVGSDLAGNFVGIRYITDGPRQQWFDPGLGSVQAGLDKLLPDTINLIISRSREEKRFLVLAFSDRDPRFLLPARLPVPKTVDDPARAPVQRFSGGGHGSDVSHQISGTRW